MPLVSAATCTNIQSLSALIRVAAHRGISRVLSDLSVKDKKQSISILTLRRLMSYIYGAPILDVSRSHTTTQHSR